MCLYKPFFFFFQMEISFNDKFLITCSLDGVICIWRLLNTEGKAIKLDKEFKPSSEILISRQDLQDRINMIKDLQLRMHELQTEHAYQMRQNDVVHNLRMKDVHEGYCSAIEELKEKNEVIPTISMISLSTTVHNVLCLATRSGPCTRDQ